ncbi:MAG: hypothetical protein ACOYI4_06840 [Christensenellales bacterium]|jgi:hypothetical protein
MICRFFDQKLDFRVRLFNALAMVGALVRFAMMLVGIATGAGVKTFVNGMAAVLSDGLLLYS